MAGSESGILGIFATVFPVNSLSSRERDALSVVSEASALSLTRHVYRELKNNPRARAALDELLRKANASELSLSEWVDQLVVTYDWLERRGHRADFGDIMDYVLCAIEGSTFQTGHDITWYLERYGFDRSEPTLLAGGVVGKGGS